MKQKKFSKRGTRVLILDSYKKIAKSKRSISPVVSTVLLIVIGIIAIGIIVGVIFPLIKGSLGKGKSCFELREYFKIVISDYTCYNSTNTVVMMERGMEDMEVKGFVVSLQSGGSSTRYDVYDGATGMQMLENSAFTNNIIIPKPGYARTYLFNTANGIGAEIAVLQTDNSVCDAEFYTIPECASIPS
jgi:hypothetical protein